MDVALLGRPLPFPPFTPPSGGGIGVENGESASSPSSPPESIKVDVEASLAPPPFLPPSPPMEVEGDGGREDNNIASSTPKSYTLLHFLRELYNPSLGAHPPPPSLPPSSSPLPARRYDVALVGHSAGGWVGRIYLSDACYDGRVYSGSRFVSTLVTLGSPNVLPEKFRGRDVGKVPYALKNLKFVDESCSNGGKEGGRKGGREGGKEGGREGGKEVRLVCVGSRAVKGGRLLGGLMKDWAASSYKLCGYEDEEGRKGGVWGDGITPVESALGLPGAEKVELEGEVLHGPEVEERGKMWYGSDPWPLERWLRYVMLPPLGAKEGEEEEMRRETGVDVGR